MVRGGKWLRLEALLFAASVFAGAAQAATYELVEQPNSDLTQPTTDGQALWLQGSPDDLRGRAGEPCLPWRELEVPCHDASSVLTYSVLEADTIDLSLPLAPWGADQISSDTASQPPAVAPDPAIYNSHRWFPSNAIRLDGFGQMGSHGIGAFHWCPYSYQPQTRQLIIVRRATLDVTDDVSPAPSPAIIDTLAIGDPLRDAAVALFDNTAGAALTPTAPGGAPSWKYPSDPPLGVEYVVVTSQAMVNAVRPLVLWKARKGINAGVATVEAIVSRYPATDAAASVREYLKQARNSGLQWVVLGGDETIAPVRTAFPDYTAYAGDPYRLEQCDLYFAELDGNWDANGNGIYGEFFGDQANIYPELYVGRLPFASAGEATVMINKIINYESGPADASYLTHSLSVSTDQFRDWDNGIGQHGDVVTAMPPSWTNDLTTMIEAPSGADPAPSYPTEQSFPQALAQGVGWVNYFVHGRADAFVVRSAGIMDWPRTYVFTGGSAGDGNSHLNTLSLPSQPGIHLSAACDQGGIDLDSPPCSQPVGRSVAERMLLIPGGGAVAYVGQSRWGWVSTSYKLTRKFFEYMADASVPNHMGVYQTLAKLAYGSYRDLVFGNNLYGDPEMPVWKGLPQSLDIAGPATFAAGVNHWTLQAFEGGGNASDVLITLSIGDSVWVLGHTGANGELPVDIALPYAANAILTASKAGDRIWYDTIPLSIISDVKDGDGALPSTYLTLSSYPSPFNAGTVITVENPVEQAVEIAVYDLLGRRVRRLQSGILAAGSQAISFDGRDENSRELASGVYFARMVGSGKAQVRKMMILH